jgi:hypothetical protein
MNRAAQDLGTSLNNIACRAAAQRNQELFRLMFELISLREKVAQAKLTPTHRRLPARRRRKAELLRCAGRNARHRNPNIRQRPG